MTLRVVYHVKTSSTAGNDSSDLWPEYLLVSSQLYNVHDLNCFPKLLLPRPKALPMTWTDRIQSNFFRRMMMVRAPIHEELARISWIRQARPRQPFSGRFSWFSVSFVFHLANFRLWHATSHFTPGFANWIFEIFSRQVFFLFLTRRASSLARGGMSCAQPVYMHARVGRVP